MWARTLALYDASRFVPLWQLDFTQWHHWFSLEVSWYRVSSYTLTVDESRGRCGHSLRFVFFLLTRQNVIVYTEMITSQKPLDGTEWGTWSMCYLRQILLQINLPEMIIRPLIFLCNTKLKLCYVHFLDLLVKLTQDIIGGLKSLDICCLLVF